MPGADFDLAGSIALLLWGVRMVRPVCSALTAHTCAQPSAPPFEHPPRLSSPVLASPPYYRAAPPPG
jgi:hypothetical protein